MDGADQIAKRMMQNRTTVEHVLDQLRREIITGRAKPGQRLVERELTERFGVSRTPVREALRRLVAMQLAVNVPYRGILVRELSLEFARHVYELRFGLEGLAAYLMAERGSVDSRDKLAAIFARIEEETRQKNRDEVMLLNNEFHSALAEGTENDLLVERIEEIWVSVNLVRSVAWQSGVRADDSLKEHRAILDGVIRRDAPAARLACELHVMSSWRVIEEALEETLAAG